MFIVYVFTLTIAQCGLRSVLRQNLAVVKSLIQIHHWYTAFSFSALCTCFFVGVVGNRLT